MFKLKNFKEIEVGLDDLLLDPNNPRFFRKYGKNVDKKMYANKDVQEDTYNRMFSDQNDFDIVELANSIKTDGYYPVDKIFVQKTENKYLVLEGNRRVTAMRFIKKMHSEGDPDYKLEAGILESFDKIKCVDLTGEPEEDIKRILGLRHQGGIKPWKPMPSSMHLFEEYMRIYCGENKRDSKNFVVDKNATETIANIFSLKASDVKSRIITFRIYLQLVESNPKADIDQSVFSLIQETIKSSSLKSHFGFDSRLGIFSPEGADLFFDLCVGTDDRPAVINEASAGDSTLRDYKFVVETNNDEYLKRVEEDREPTSKVKGDIKARQNERSLILTLEQIAAELHKIRLGDIKPEDLGDRERELIGELQNLLNRLRGAAGGKL